MRRLASSPLLLALFFLTGGVIGAPPDWWSEEDTRVLVSGGSAANAAPANLGQLKHMAKQAKKHLDETLPGGAGSAINNMVAAFTPIEGETYTIQQREALVKANYAPLNLGQLKAVAKPFYDRLLAVGYDTKANLIARGYPGNWAYNYPWNPNTPVAQNYAPANLGQLKMVFSFDASGLDSDSDGLLDLWEMQWFGNLNSGGNDDPDNDGLTNSQEVAAGTDPMSADTDNDGMPDGWEVANGLNPLSDDASGDSDSDGLPDGWEYTHFESLSQSGSGDADSDGLSNLEEYQLGTDPQEADSDGDGLEDGAEVNTHQTDPLSVDSDSDGMPDGWEVANGLDPLSDDGEEDPDGDELSNLEEYQEGSDPNDYYSQGSETIEPVVEVVGGNNQAGMPGSWIAEPLKVKVKNADGGAPLINAPLAMAVSSGSGLLALEKGDSSPVSSMELRSGSGGMAEVYFKQGGAAETTEEISVSAGSATPVVFSARTSQADGLWARWRFDEDTGTTAANGTGWTLNGTLHNQTQWSGGFDGRGGVELSGFTSQGGTNAYVSMGNPAGQMLDFGKGSFSISIWLKFTDVSKPSTPLNWGRRILSKGHHGWNPGYFMGTGNWTGQIRTGIGSTQSGNHMEGILFGTVDEYNDGRWHHVAIVYDRENETARIYVDGQAQELFQEAGTGGELDAQDPTLMHYPGLEYLTATRGDMPLTVSSHQGNYDYYHGGVSDLRFYRKALSQGEIQAIHHTDEDEDGLPDYWEWEQFEALSHDGTADSDNDGLSDLAEYQAGTDPNASDSDNDGMPDGWEVANGLDPLSDDGADDPDNDGLGNLEEYQLSSDPQDADSDADGLPDGWEYANFGDFEAGANDDPDGDGINNLAEYQNDSDPLDYFNGVAPVLERISGNKQTGEAEEPFTLPLKVRVKDGQDNPLSNAPVGFEVISGGGLLSEEEETPDVEWEVRTDSQGYAEISFVGDAAIGVPNTVEATAGTASAVEFTVPLWEG